MHEQEHCYSQKAPANTDADYTIKTDAATVRIQVTDKPTTGEQTREYLKCCHARLVGVPEAGSPSIPLAERIAAVVRALGAHKKEIGWLTLVKEQLHRILPVHFRDEPIQYQAAHVVNRLQEVQERLAHVTTLNQNQANQISDLEKRIHNQADSIGHFQNERNNRTSASYAACDELEHARVVLNGAPVNTLGTLPARIQTLINAFISANGQLVQENKDLSERSHNQFKSLTGVFDALNKACVANGSGTPAERVQALDSALKAALKANDELINEHSKISHQLERTDDDCSRILGIATSYTGSLLERIGVLGQNLITALRANQEFVKASTCIGVTATQVDGFQRQINILREENNRLRNDNAGNCVYKKSVDAAHAYMTELGVEKAGNVKARIMSFREQSLRRESQALAQRNDHCAALDKAHSVLHECNVPQVGGVAERIESYRQVVDRRLSDARTQIEMLLEQRWDVHAKLTSIGAPDGCRAVDRIQALADNIRQSFSNARPRAVREILTKIQNLPEAVKLLVRRNNEERGARLKSVFGNPLF